MLKDTIRTSRSVNALSDFQFRVWAYLITYVDDYGRGSADPELLKGMVFPRRKGVTESQIQSALDYLASTGMVNLYKVDGEPYFYFPNWSKHQRIQTKKSKFPEPPVNGELQKSTVNHGESRWVTESHGESPLEIETKPKPETEIEIEAYASSSVAADKSLRQNVQRVIDAWNGIPGVNGVERLNTTSKRYQSLKARLDEYGVEKVLEAVEKVKESDFLRGKSRKGWVITFDWFVLPNNFPKVLEGNYENREVSEYGIFGRPDPGEAQGERQELPGVVVL